MADDPVSWLMIEPGWTVVDADGNDVGRVEEVTGDSTHDIFDGLSIASGMFSRPRYVPAESIVEITGGCVRIASPLAGLDEFREPAASEAISSERAGILRRLESDVEPHREHEHRVGLVRRALLWLGLAGRR